MHGGRLPLGDGVGALCPVCPTWFRDADEVWRDHLVGEHPGAWERLVRACRSEVARERTAVRAEVHRQVTATAALVAEARGRRAA